MTGTNRIPPQNLSGIHALHASAIQVSDQVFVFLGPSGTGKSTICGLFDGFAQPIALDAIFLIPQAHGGWHVVRGDGRAYSRPLRPEEAEPLKGMRLRAIFRLFQSPGSQLEKTGALQTCRYLTDAFFEIVWQRNYPLVSKHSAFATLAAVARSVPGFEFFFDLSPQGIALIQQEINRLASD